MMGMEEELSAMMDMMGSILTDDRLPKSIAKFVRNLHDALEAEGFSKEESLKLSAALGNSAIQQNK